MRVVVIGTSGSGKTTLARRLAADFSLPLVEIDRINWQPGWRGLNADHPAEFIRRVENAVAGDRWVTDGTTARCDRSCGRARPIWSGSITSVAW